MTWALTPELIIAWGAFASAIIGAIGTVAYKAAKADNSGASQSQQISYLVLDAKQAQLLAEGMGALSAQMVAVGRKLEAITEGQDRVARTIGDNIETTDKVLNAATEMRIAMATLTDALRHYPPRR